MKVLLLALALLLPFAANAADSLAPYVPKGQGEKCVEDVEVMRRDHMTLLTHQRDKTLREGVRTKTHSLKECIACHVVKDGEGKPVTIADERHFCRSCHGFAAVKPDCFSCHASTPEAQKAER
ncbi:MAG: hypothetical protein A2516_11530 [Alphaproteobacteria bacterium RIFOXYD12_FULL_60_8]|nr:MAG: hypothetical protein A2516_11530 [Alphaproteobacteria bacterium RIFOXYD12_FULL_60_8]